MAFFLAIFEGFMLTPCGDLNISSILRPYEALQSLECLVKIPNHSKSFWSYVNFFILGFSGSRGLIGARDKEKNKSFIFEGLDCKILIRFGTMTCFEMLYTMMEGELKFWIFARSQAPISLL